MSEREWLHERAGDEVMRVADRVDEWLSAGEVAGDCGREAATGAMVFTGRRGETNSWISLSV